MLVLDTGLRDAKLLQPKRYGDSRGWFAEVFNEEAFAEAGLPHHFVQDNQSVSCRGVLRGLHYQVARPQGKLIRVLAGHIFDVAVDLRRDSPDFGKWTGLHLRMESPEDPLQMLWIPEGFAHGFLVLSASATVLYKTTDFYDPTSERAVLWNDPALSINWPLASLGGLPPAVSAKDAIATSFVTAELPQSMVLQPRG